MPSIVKSPTLSSRSPLPGHSATGYSANFGKESSGLGTMADILDTVRDLAGLSSTVTAGTDSKSLVPFLIDDQFGTSSALADDFLHPFVYAEFFNPNGSVSFEGQSQWASLINPNSSRFQNSYRRAVRDKQYKLIRENGQDTQLYDLLSDPLEAQNLISSTTPAHMAARVDLIGKMGSLVGLQRCGSRNDIDGDGHCDDDDKCVILSDSGDGASIQAIQPDQNGNGFGDACDGDLDGSGATTISDFNNYIRACIGKSASSSATCGKADMDVGGLVTILDFNLFKAQMGAPLGPSGYCHYSPLLPCQH